MKMDHWKSCYKNLLSEQSEGRASVSRYVHCRLVAPHHLKWTRNGCKQWWSASVSRKLDCLLAPHYFNVTLQYDENGCRAMVESKCFSPTWLSFSTTSFQCSLKSNSENNGEQGRRETLCSLTSLSFSSSFVVF